MGASRIHSARGTGACVTALIVVCLLVATPVAQAQSWTPSSEPERSGPLYANADASCGQGEARAPDGTVAARSDGCIWWFEYLPILETDLQRDHGVLWLQASITPERGFCIVGANFGFTAEPDAFRLETSMPEEGRSATRSGPTTFSLTTDAAGAGLQEGSVMATNVPQQRGTKRTIVAPKQGSVEVRWKATEPTDEPVNAVIGLAVSWSGDLPGSLLRTYGVKVNLRSTLTPC